MLKNVLSEEEVERIVKFLERRCGNNHDTEDVMSPRMKEAFRKAREEGISLSEQAWPDDEAFMEAVRKMFR